MCRRVHVSYNHVDICTHSILPHVAKQSAMAPHICEARVPVVNRYYAQYYIHNLEPSEELAGGPTVCGSYCRCGTTTLVDHETQLVMSVD